MGIWIQPYFFQLKKKNFFFLSPKNSGKSGCLDFLGLALPSSSPHRLLQWSLSLPAQVAPLNTKNYVNSGIVQGSAGIGWTK